MLQNYRQRPPSNLSYGDFLGMQLVAFSYVAVAAKTTNIADSRYSESASDLQQ